jgi:predicted amidohydrolase YtcJ
VKRLILTVLLCGGVAQGAERVDVILYAGKIVTQDTKNSMHSAMAIRGERILALGDDSLTQRYSAPLVLDLNGRTVIPGFMDTHLHIFGVSRRTVPAADARSIAELQDMVRAKARELDPGEWITGMGWDESLLSDRRRPLRADMDAAAPDNPVILHREGGHSGVANSLALKLAKLTRNSPDPANGVLERDATGELNGVIRERTDLVSNLVPPPTMDEMRDSFVSQLKELPRVGLTSVIIAGAALDPKAAPFGTTPSWDELRGLYAKRGDEFPRAAVQIIYPGPGQLDKFPHRTGWGDNRLRLGAIGEGPAVDGGFTGPTACTFHDYKGQPGFRGRCFFEQAKLDEIAADVARNGWQLGLHMIGDRGITMGIDAYVKALKKYPDKGDRRWYASHFTMQITPQALDGMAANDIYASAQPNFTWSLSERYQETLEGDALGQINPVATPLKHKVKLVFGADYPLTRHPRYGLYSAVTRKGKDGYQFAISEAVPIAEAIRLYTAAPPFLTWEEKQKGTLEPGKLADLIVLDRDPYSVAPSALLNLQVDITMIGGRIIHDRLRDGPSKYEPASPVSLAAE